MEIPDDGVGDKDSKRMQQDGVKKRKAKLCDMPRDNILFEKHFLQVSLSFKQIYS